MGGRVTFRSMLPKKQASKRPTKGPAFSFSSHDEAWNHLTTKANRSKEEIGVLVAAAEMGLELSAAVAMAWDFLDVALGGSPREPSYPLPEQLMSTYPPRTFPKELVPLAAFVGTVAEPARRVPAFVEALPALRALLAGRDELRAVLPRFRSTPQTVTAFLLLVADATKKKLNYKDHVAVLQLLPERPPDQHAAGSALQGLPEQTPDAWKTMNSAVRKNLLPALRTLLEGTSPSPVTASVPPDVLGGAPSATTPRSLAPTSSSSAEVPPEESEVSRLPTEEAAAVGRPVEVPTEATVASPPPSASTTASGSAEVPTQDPAMTTPPTPEATDGKQS